MKVVINRCYGGFSLSWAAVKRIAEIEERPFYLFKRDNIGEGPLKRVEELPEESLASAVYYSAFDIPNPAKTIKQLSKDGWAGMTDIERRADSELYEKHNHSTRPDDRTNKALVQAVEEMGARANGQYAALRVVEIPDGVDWEIDEYDGIETVREKSRSWV